MTDLERIEEKLDEVLFLLGKGRGRTTEELRRKAQADIIRLQSRKPMRKRSHECAEPSYGLDEPSLFID